jgi:hypothetical protein
MIVAMSRWLALVAVVALGCERSYWVAGADLQKAHVAAAKAAPGDGVAVGSGDLYLRYSQLRVGRPAGDAVQVTAPNKRGKRIGGAVLLGVGAALVAGGVALVGYGASLRHRDSLGAGIVAGLGALPIGAGIALAIPGAILLARARGPSDVVAPGDPAIVYVPSR